MFNYNGLIRMFDDDEYQKDPDIPDEYQKFLPENIEKDRYSHPYSYDPFFIFFNKEGYKRSKKKTIGCIYSDRLLQWDYKKHNILCKKHFDNEGQYWDKRESKKIEAFLSDFLDKKIVLVANIQYVNLSNGYPLWRFDFYDA